LHTLKNGSQSAARGSAALRGFVCWRIRTGGALPAYEFIASIVGEVLRQQLRAPAALAAADGAHEGA
jgi:hypothetical protein